MRESLLSADIDTGQDHFPLGSDYKNCCMEICLRSTYFSYMHRERFYEQKKSAAMGFSVSVWFNWDRGLKKPVFLRSQWWGGRKQVAIQIASWLPVMYVFRNAWLWRIAISPNEEWSTKLKHQQKVLNLAKSFSPSLQRKITISLNIQLFSYLHSQEGESPDHLPSVLQVRVLFPLLIVKHTLQE